MKHVQNRGRKQLDKGKIQYIHVYHVPQVPGRVQERNYETRGEENEMGRGAGKKGRRKDKRFMTFMTDVLSMFMPAFDVTVM